MPSSLRHPTPWLRAFWQRAYRENVTGGPGNFVLEVHDFRTFGEAMARKLVTEIADGDARRSLAAMP